MLVAEDVLLLTDDQTGNSNVGPTPGFDLGLAGANLLHLALRRKGDVAADGEAVKRGWAVVHDATRNRRVTPE